MVHFLRTQNEWNHTENEYTEKGGNREKKMWNVFINFMKIFFILLVHEKKKKKIMKKKKTWMFYWSVNNLLNFVNHLKQYDFLFSLQAWIIHSANGQQQKMKSFSRYFLFVFYLSLSLSRIFYGREQKLFLFFFICWKPPKMTKSRLNFDLLFIFVCAFDKDNEKFHHFFVVAVPLF